MHLTADHLCKIILALIMLPSVLAFHAEAQEQIVLEAPSDQGTFMVEIAWTPDDVGSTNSFDIRFIEPETGEEIEDVIYDISIYSGGDREILRRDQTVSRQEFTFDEPGSYEIRIDDIEGLGERVTIPIQVTPEFPLGVMALIAVVLSTTLLITRRNCNNLFSQSTS